jgi:hypothetical protein
MKIGMMGLAAVGLMVAASAANAGYTWSNLTGTHALAGTHGLTGTHALAGTHGLTGTHALAGTHGLTGTHALAGTHD